MAQFWQSGIVADVVQSDHESLRRLFKLASLVTVWSGNGKRMAKMGISGWLAGIVLGERPRRGRQPRG